MPVIKLRPGTLISNPADPLGPPLAICADGQASLVVRGPHDSLEDIVAKAKTIRQQMRVARKGAKNTLDRRRRRGHNPA